MHHKNAGLEEAQAGIKIVRRNINNLRYADDITHMAESEEDLKSLLMKVKIVWYLYQNRNISQWNRIEGCSEINSHTYSQLIYNKWSKNVQWRKSFLDMWCWENCIVIYKTMKLA